MNTLWKDRPDPIGIHFKSTPSHGYIVLSLERLAQLPAVLKTPNKWYEGGTHFEEDCEWSRVALAFPEIFPADEVQRAAEIIERYNPQLWEAWNNAGRPTAPAQ